MLEDSSARIASAADIGRNFGMWQDKAATGPVIVTSHGRPRVVLIAFDDYEQLSRDAASTGHDGAAAAEASILLDHIPEAFVAFDTQLNFRSINAAARAYWAVPDCSLIGQRLIHAFPMLDDGVIVSQLRRVLLSHEEATFDAPSHLYPDRLLRFRAFPYPGGIAMIFSDIATELDSQRETARRLSLRAAGEAHGEVGVAIITVRGTFSQVGRSFAAIAESSVAGLLGLSPLDLIRSDLREAAHTDLEAVLGGAAPRAFESALTLAGGAEQRVRVGLAEIREGFTVSGATVMLTAKP